MAIEGSSGGKLSCEGTSKSASSGIVGEGSKSSSSNGIALHLELCQVLSNDRACQQAPSEAPLEAPLKEQDFQFLWNQ